MKKIPTRTAGLACVAIVAAALGAPAAHAAPIGLCDANVQIGQTTVIYHYGHYDTLRFADWWDTRGYVDRHTHVWENRTHGNVIHQACGIPGAHRAHPQRN